MLVETEERVAATMCEASSKFSYNDLIMVNNFDKSAQKPIKVIKKRLPSQDDNGTFNVLPTHKHITQHIYKAIHAARSPGATTSRMCFLCGAA